MESFYGEENTFDTTKLGLTCFVISDKFYKQGDCEKALYYGKKSLTILSDNVKPRYLLKSNVLCLLGSVCIDLKNYDESVSYLSLAEGILTELDQYNSRVSETVLNVQLELRYVKGVMGRKEEAVIHSKNVLGIKEKIMDNGSVGLGEANKDVAVAYIEALDFRRALPFCLKAVEIYTECLGCDSLEVAEVKINLAVIYYEMGECKKALELNREAMNDLKKTSPGSMDLLILETEGADMLIKLGRCEEEVNVLKDMVSRDDIKGGLRVKSLLAMARASCSLGKFDDAVKCLSVAQRIIEEIEMDPMNVALGFEEMAVLFQNMNDFETAISLIKRALVLPGLPQRLFPELCGGLVLLISESGKEKEEVTYMEDEVEKLKVSFGPKHCVVGCGYSILGAIYLETGEKELGAQFLADAKDILDDTIGPHHLTSLTISHCLSECYAMSGSHRQALEIGEKVVQAFKGMEPSELQFLHKVVTHKNNVKRRVADEDLTATISRRGNSDDENGT